MAREWFQQNADKLIPISLGLQVIAAMLALSRKMKGDKTGQPPHPDHVDVKRESIRPRKPNGITSK